MNVVLQQESLLPSKDVTVIKLRTHKITDEQTSSTQHCLHRCHKNLLSESHDLVSARALIMIINVSWCPNKVHLIWFWWHQLFTHNMPLLPFYVC